MPSYRSVFRFGAALPVPAWCVLRSWSDVLSLWGNFTRNAGAAYAAFVGGLWHGRRRPAVRSGVEREPENLVSGMAAGSTGRPWPATTSRDQCRQDRDGNRETGSPLSESRTQRRILYGTNCCPRQVCGPVSLVGLFETHLTGLLTIGGTAAPAVNVRSSRPAGTRNPHGPCRERLPLLCHPRQTTHMRITARP